MKAIILAAGRGSRLGPYGAERPKCLVELAGMTLIDRQLATLRRAGVEDIVIVAGYRAEQLELPGVRRRVNPRWERTNMVESLFCTADELAGDVIVSYGDIVYEPRLLAALLRGRHDATVVVDRGWRAYWEHRFADPLSDAESLQLDADGRIADIGSPVDAIDAIEGQYIGLMRFRGDGIAALTAARAHMGTVSRPWMDRRPPEGAYMTDLIMEMILMGHPVHAAPVTGGWLEIDSAADYEAAASMFADGTIARFYDPAALIENT